MLGIGCAKLYQWTHERAVTLVGDVERPRILQQSGSKRAAGRLVILGMAMVITLFAVTWSSNQQPPFRTTRHWLSVLSLEEQTGFMNENADNLANGIMLCPCLNSYREKSDQIAYRHLILFYLVSPDPKKQGAYIREPDPEIEDRMNLVANSQAVLFEPDLCSKALPPNSSYIESVNTFCNSLAGPIASYVNSNDEAWLNPIRFLNRACRGLKAVIYYTGNGTTELTTSEKVSVQVSFMWNSGLDVGARWSRWPPPEDADFCSGRIQYALASDNMPELNVSSTAFAMRVNWTVYYQSCSPPYCDTFVYTSLGWSVFVSVAQVGGFLSLALVILRALLWPMIQAFFGWRTEPTAFLTIDPTNNVLPTSSGQLPPPPQDIGSSQKKHPPPPSRYW